MNGESGLTESRLLSDWYPRASAYNPDWLAAAASGGANPLWLAEWLTSAMELRPGMRVLDLGCGRAASSIFLHREFGVQVWGVDLWFSPGENLQRIRDAGVENSVFPLRCDARQLPFAPDFFDAILSIDSFLYYGTDDFFLPYLLRFLKPAGVLGIAGAGLIRELEEFVPEALRGWWTPDLWSLHSATWWRRHWQRTQALTVDIADTMPEGWKLWLVWQQAVAPENTTEYNAVLADQGQTLGYVRVVGHRKADVSLAEPIMTVPTQYVQAPLLRKQSPPTVP